MAQTSKTFRIFISSTFSDLKEERNALQEQVFPRLRDLCLQHGARFQAIDLRWGVSEEAGLDQRTMKICLEEIARCQKTTPRPNFIVLLGDRYGWHPLPHEIQADEFEQILENIQNTDDKELLTRWYWRDDNAVPPVYCLQPRTGVFTDSDRWGLVEYRLRSILLEAIGGLRLGPADKLKYNTSATEQEIIQGVLHIPDADEHVFCFSREFGVTQKDGTRLPLKETPPDRSFHDFVDLDPQDSPDLEAGTKHDSLKKRLSELLGKNMYHYEVEWDGGAVTDEYLKQLCDDALRSLSQIIIKEASALKELGVLDNEIGEHQSFGKERVRFFTGRRSTLQSISDYLKGNDTHPLGIFGDSGSGKTALMARAAEKARETCPEAQVVFRFIGTTPSSTDGRSLLESLCRQLSRPYGEDESTTPTDYRELVEEFPKRLALATKEKPLILFLDALDQLSDVNNARDLSWLPSNLPEHVRLVVSVVQESEFLAVLQRKLPEQNLVELKPMSTEEGQELLDLWLKDAHRTLQARQRDEVLSKFEQCRLPLYLKLAFEEARRWKSYTEKVELSENITGVIRDLFERLSSETNHGEIMVSHSLGYLAAAKNGLTEDEMLTLLSEDSDVMADFHRRSPKSPDVPRLPVVVWSRLFLDLEPYFTERAADGTSLMTFYHPTTFGREVRARYLAGDTKRERHHFLAQYFGGQKLYIETDEQKVCNLRKVSELPYQQIYGELWDETYSTLTDFGFLEAKCTHVAVEEESSGKNKVYGGVYELIEDYRRALDVWPEHERDRTEVRLPRSRGAEHNPKTRREILQTYVDFMHVQSHRLVRHPDWFFPLAHSEPISTPMEVRAEAIRQEGGGPCRPWLRWVREKTELLEPQRLMGQDHEDAVFADQGRWIVSCVARATFEGEGIMWDAITGRPLRSMTQIQAPLAAAHLRNLIAYADLKKCVHLLDLETGVDLRPFPPEPVSVEALAISPDDRLLACATKQRKGDFWGDSVPGRLVLWDLEQSCEVWSLGSSSNNVGYGCLAFSPDGRLLATSQKHEVLIIDTGSGTVRRRLVGHTEHVAVAAFSPDGTILATGGAGYNPEDGEVLLWDLMSGLVLDTPTQMAQRSVYSLAFSPDGKRLVIGDQSGRLDIFETGTWRLESSVTKTSWGLRSLCFSPDGRRLVGTSGPDGLLLWHIPSHPLTPANKWAHSDWVRQVTFTPAMDLMVSLSYYELITSDMQSGHLIQRVALDGGILSLACAPDNRTAACGGSLGRIYLVDLGHGEITTQLSGMRGTVKALSFAPNSSRLVALSEEDGLVCFVLNRKKNTVEWRHPDLRGRSLAWSPDGSQILVGSSTGVAHIIDVRSREARILGPRRQATIFTVGWSGSGCLVSMAGWDGELHVLTAPDFTLQTKLQADWGSGFDDYGPPMAFSPTDQYIAWSAEKQLVRVSCIDGTPAGEMETISPVMALVWDSFPYRLRVADSGSNSGLQPCSYLLEHCLPLLPQATQV